MVSESTQRNALLQKAKILFASGNIEKSIEVFSAAEKNGLGSVDLWLSRGAAQMALGNYHAAKEDFSRVLKEDTRNERAHYYRGIALVALGKYEEGIDDLTSSLMQNNNRGIAHLVRGLAYSELGQESDAALDMNSASAFSDAEITSFKKLFNDFTGSFPNTKAMLAKENAPWNNLLSQDSANKLLNLLQ
jgi:tetratricopeptide (TPR) repeat protein